MDLMVYHIMYGYGYCRRIVVIILVVIFWCHINN